MDEVVVFLATQILSSINHTADPCEDFFQYACGGWKMSHPIPDNQSAIDNFWLLTEKMKIVKQSKLVCKNVLETDLSGHIIFVDLLDMPQKDLSFTAEAKVKGVYQQCKRTGTPLGKAQAEWEPCFRIVSRPVDGFFDTASHNFGAFKKIKGSIDMKRW